MIYLLLARALKKWKPWQPAISGKTAGGAGGHWRKADPRCRGISVAADITVEEMKLDEMDMIVDPGGWTALHPSKAALHGGEYALSNKLLCSSICVHQQFSESGAGWMDDMRFAIPAARRVWARR